ncbi:MAG: hypothetical protein U1U88_001529 [Lawsonella clevelandensis]
MVPYLVKVNELSYDGPSQYNARLPKITFRPAAPRKSTSPCPPTTALMAPPSKTMMATTTSSLSAMAPTTKFGATATWAPAAGNLSTATPVEGSEGPSLTKLNGKYFLYTDKLSTWEGLQPRQPRGGSQQP